MSRDYAFDLLLFAQRNPKSCPLLDVLEPGAFDGPLVGDADVRTDQRDTDLVVP